MCRFVPPSEEMAKRMGISFDEWEIGKQGPLKVAYPATVPEADLIIQEVRPVICLPSTKYIHPFVQSFVQAGIPRAHKPVSIAYVHEKDKC